MNIKEIKEIKEKIRNSYFQPIGFAAVTFMGCGGMLFIFKSGIFSAENYKMIYDCISESGFLIIVGLILVIFSLYCWLIYFRNMVLNPKEEILYFYKNNENEFVFLNKKGKKFIYENNNMKENYYVVLKTYDYIYEVLGECKEPFKKWIPKEKKSYWLNFYSRLIKINDFFLLPFVYIILLIGLLSFIMSEGIYKIPGLIISVYQLYIIGYDLIYKIKLKKSNGNIINKM